MWWKNCWTRWKLHEPSKLTVIPIFLSARSILSQPQKFSVQTDEKSTVLEILRTPIFCKGTCIRNAHVVFWHCSQVVMSALFPSEDRGRLWISDVFKLEIQVIQAKLSSKSSLYGLIMRWKSLNKSLPRISYFFSSFFYNLFIANGTLTFWTQVFYSVIFAELMLTWPSYWEM